MAQKKERAGRPAPLTQADRRTLARILKKARAFKAFYASSGKQKSRK